MIKNNISLKVKGDNNYWITFFTPTFQRANTLHRVYESLINMQTQNDTGGGISFEWLIVDDGSTDGTDKLVDKWCKKNLIPIRYFWQENQGKHVATNFAVQHSNSFAFGFIDSDDTLLPTALTIIYQEWSKIENKEAFKGVNGRCIDPKTKKILGSPLPSSPFDVNEIDLRYKYNIKGEMWGFIRLDIMKQYPFPTPDPRMRYCPEGIVWYEIAKKYKARVLDNPVREYFTDTANAITGKNHNRSIANYYGWRYGVNNFLPYIFFSPKKVIKNFVGLSMDGIRTGRSFGTIIGDAHSMIAKAITVVFFPVGWLLTKR